MFINLKKAYNYGRMVLFFFSHVITIGLYKHLVGT